MKESARMRQGDLRELKNLQRFFSMMETSVKRRNPDDVMRAYVFLKTLVYHMNDGDLNPLNIELHKELLIRFHEDTNIS